VNSVAIDRDGLLLVSGSEDRTVRLWRLETGATVQTFPVLSGMIRSVTFSADGQLVAVADWTTRFVCGASKLVNKSAPLPKGTSTQ
jgi:WD40 repeat protein